MVVRWFFILILGFMSLATLYGEKRVYSIVSAVNVRKAPSLKAQVIDKLRHGTWVEKKGEPNSHWVEIETPTGEKGFVFSRLVTDRWIKIYKRERKVFLMRGGKVERQYSAALGFNPRDDKVRQGDGCTPEGRFFICQWEKHPAPKTRYGERSFRISYPNIEDARRALKDKLITKAQYHAILRAVHKGKMPPQNTVLGGSIKIHGGGVGEDWTLGCVAMRDNDIIDLYSKVPQKLILTDIYHSKTQHDRLNRLNILNRDTLKAMDKLKKKPCTYTSKATRIIPLKYPMGDLDPSQGVCTDVAIRTLRYLNIDLQALMYEDIFLHPSRYPSISTPNPNIDHRRTRNLKILLDHHALKLTHDPPRKKPKEWLPGDIVLMDTGISNGTIYDHIGIVSSQRQNGIPLVLNLWTVGSKLEDMDLLQGDYPKIVGHYRLKHLFYYNTIDQW